MNNSLSPENYNPNSKLYLWLAFILPVLLLVLALWLPFGFNLIGLIEEWGILKHFSDRGLFFITDTSTPIAIHALRPLTVFPQAVAYFLDANSFNYWHVLLILTLVIKGMAASTLFWQATGSLRWSIVMGLMVLVYPADTMQLSFRALHINWALSLSLLASTLLVAAYQTSKHLCSYVLGFLAGVCLLAALCMYEATLPLTILPFLILYAKHGFHASLKQCREHKSLILIWLLAIGTYLVYVVVVSRTIDSYQQSLIGHQNPLKTFLIYFPNLFNPGMLRSLIGGWFDAIRMVSKELSVIGYLYVASAISVIGIIAMYLLKRNNAVLIEQDEPHSKNWLIRLATVALLTTLLGYFPFVFSPPHIYISQRTYLFATPGAAMFWVALLMGLAQWQKTTARLVAFLLIAIGLGAQLFQFHHYVQLAETQRLLLRNIVSNFDNTSKDKTLIIRDESNQLTHTWMFLWENLSNALTYVYGHHVNKIEICHMPENAWKLVGSSLGQSGLCIEKEKQWVFQAPAAISGPNYTPPPAPPGKTVLKKDAVVITIKPDGSVTPDSSLTAYRERLMHDHSSQAKRFQQILMPSTWATHFNKLWAVDSHEAYHWSFGNWWSMELPTRGTGWQEAEWDTAPFHHHAKAWKNRENSSLLFELAPKKSPYRLQVKLTNMVNESVRQSIELRINQHSIPYKWLTNEELEAEVPFDVLLHGTNTLTFHSIIVPTYYGYSFTLSNVELAPV